MFSRGVVDCKELAHRARRGVSRVEFICVCLVLLLLCSIGVPFVLHARESSRKSLCVTRLKEVVNGLTQYHQHFGHLPAAASWDASALNSPDLHRSRHWQLFISQNWAIDLLPFLNRTELHQKVAPDSLICSDENAFLRESLLPEFRCPSDSYSREDNAFVYKPRSKSRYSFARGNFGINGGTSSIRTDDGDTSSPGGDRCHLANDVGGKFEFWANGIAGINKSFSFDEFANGRSSTVAVDEIRAGIDPEDIRGTWALGHIAASITWGQGVNGDAGSPNNPWARSDDIQGGGNLNRKYGPEKLIELGMPCVSYVDINQNAAARSQHAGGVNVGFLDGAVSFVSNNIDPSLWHVIHSRETPAAIFNGKPPRLWWQGSADEAERATFSSMESAESFTNSLGMKFVSIPAGKFVMGVPDVGFETDLPPETPPHEVEISSSFHMATTEVSNHVFQSVMQNGSEFDAVAESEPDFPVTDVTWYRAVEFCKRLSDLPAEVAAGRTYRLPTEAEWEYSCRETSSAPYSLSTAKTQAAVTGEAAGLLTGTPLAAVGSYPPNSLGLHDMRGNAWEWCSDWFDRDYYQRSRVEDPAGPADGYVKVLRGSNWIYVGEGCYINYPILPPWKSSSVVGFRVVAVPGGPGASE